MLNKNGNCDQQQVSIKSVFHILTLNACAVVFLKKTPIEVN
jgi:hypothetical protein